MMKAGMELQQQIEAFRGQQVRPVTVTGGMQPV